MFKHTEIANINIPLWRADLNWYRTGSIDESASGQPSSSTRISQEGDGGQTGWEHAGTDRREHSGWTPSDLLWLMRQAHQRDEERSGAKRSDCLTYQNVFEDFFSVHYKLQLAASYKLSAIIILPSAARQLKYFQISVVFHQRLKLGSSCFDVFPPSWVNYCKN